MYVTQHNRSFEYIVPLIEKYKDQINFKTRPLGEIVSGPYFSTVFAESKLNLYCATKCNRHKKKIRKEVVLRDTFFQNNPATAAGSTP